MASEQAINDSKRTIRELTLAEMNCVSGGRLTTNPLNPPSPTFPPVEI